MLTKLQEKLQGYKTYIALLAVVALVVHSWITGETSTMDAIKMVLAALAGGTMAAKVNRLTEIAKE